MGLVQSFLIHSIKESELWRILTFWQIKATLDAMRGSGETQRGVLIFREANAEPALSVFQIAQQFLPE